AEQAHLLGIALALLRRFHRAPDRGEHHGAVGIDRVESPRTDERFDDAAIHEALVHALAEVVQVLEGSALFARRDDAIDRRLARTFDPAQTVADGFFVHRFEAIRACVDVR